jgi:hypothetical protein
VSLVENNLKFSVSHIGDRKTNTRKISAVHFFNRRLENNERKNWWMNVPVWHTKIRLAWGTFVRGYGD